VKLIIKLSIVIILQTLLTHRVNASTEQFFEINVNTSNLVHTRFIPSEGKNFTADETGIYIPSVRSITKFDHQMNKLWYYTTNDIYNGFSSLILISGEEIYITGSPSDIYKINKLTGELIDHIRISYFTPSPWYSNPPIIMEDKIITWGNNQICILTKTPMTRIHCKTTNPWSVLNYRYYLLDSGALVGKTEQGNVNSYKVNKLEEEGVNDYTNWRSMPTAKNSESNTNIASNTDKNGYIYYLSGGRYGPTEDYTYYLIKINAGNGDTVEDTKEIKTYATNSLAFETIQIDKTNNIAYFILNNKKNLTDRYNQEYKTLYAVDLNKTAEEEYIKYTYDFPTYTYINKNILLHNQKIYINNGKELYIFDHNGFYTKLNIGYKLLGSPQVFKNDKDQYILYAHTTAQVEEYNTNRFIGIKVEDLKYCPTGLYCNTTPKHHPIIFIHGFGGEPASWDTGDKKEYKERILQQYRQDDPEFPEEWLVSYSYGVDNNGKYDYQGRIENISAGLNQLVPFLSNEHKFHGGDGQVDIVGYSLGGVVARNYLYNNSENHHIQKLITIASPHKGVDWLNYDFNLRTCLLVQCFGPTNVLKDIASTFLNYYKEEENKLDLLSGPVYQLTPNSNRYYLNTFASHQFNDINATAMYGNIALKTSFRLFGIEIKKEISVGDGLVLSNSAMSIPEISSLKTKEYKDQIELDTFLQPAGLGYFYSVEIPNLVDNKYSHLQIPRQTEVINDVIEILTNDK